jgi:hypothetical protein
LRYSGANAKPLPVEYSFLEISLNINPKSYGARAACAIAFWALGFIYKNGWHKIEMNRN